MRTEDEGIDEGPSAADVLAVADGLRRRDPQLSAALAEHAVRLSPDRGRRGDAELSAVLAHRELDRPVEVVARGVPLLRDAERAGRHVPAASLRCALAECALAWSDTGLAEALLDPLMAGDGLPEDARLVIAGARADLCAALGDVAGTDTAAADVGPLRAARENVVLARHDLCRARARARRVGRDPRGARELLDAAPEVPESADGGRREVLIALDRVEVALDLGDTASARETARAVLDRTVGVTTALPMARVRCVLAARVHLPAGEVDAAASLVRAVVDDLSGRGQDHQMAIAQELLSAIAEAQRDPAAALVAERRAHRLERRALLAAGRARVELAGVAYGVGPADETSRDPGGLDLPGSAPGANGHRPAEGPAVPPARRPEPVDPGAADAAEPAGDRREGRHQEPADRPDPEGTVDLAREGWDPSRAEPPSRPRRSGGVHADPWLAPREDAGSGGEDGDDDGAAVRPPGGVGSSGRGRNGHRASDRPGETDSRPARRSRHRENGTDDHDDHDRTAGRPTRTARTSDRTTGDDREAGRSGGSRRSRTNGTGPSAPDRRERFGDVDPSTHDTDDPGPARDEEYDRELAVTLAGLLAEYRDTDRADRTDRPEPEPPAPDDRSSTWADGDVRRPWPLAAWSFHEETGPRGADAAAARDAVGETAPLDGAGGPDDSGARLADLLAEAMDAFRRTAPGETDLSPPPTDRRGAPR